MLTDTQKKLLPFLAEYEKLGEILCPYMMRTTTPNYKSNMISTDEAGFRYTKVGNYDLSPLSKNILKKDMRVNILLGSSALFGIGASNNKYTIPSCLAKKGINNPINFGIPAFNSTQELISFLLFRPQKIEIERIIIFSGINNFTLKEIGKCSLPNISPLFNNDIVTFNINKDKSSKELIKALLKKFISQININNQKNENKKDPYTEQFDPINQTINDLKIIHSIAKNENSKLYFFFQPLASLMNKKFSVEEKMIFDSLKSKSYETKFLNKKIISQYNEKINFLESFCKEESISYFNLNNELKTKSDDWFFSDSVHLTDYGYSICSNFIKSVL